MAATHTNVRAPYPPAAEVRPVIEVLARIGDRWTVLVISALWQGPMRYNALQRTLDGISQRMLTLTLRRMEQDGLVARTLLPAVPPHVEYALTDLGHTLVAPLHGLYEWTLRSMPAIVQARARFEAAQRGRRDAAEGIRTSPDP